MTELPQRPNPSDRPWLQNIATALIRWMPLGGSGFILASSVWQQDWWMTALSFPATVVTAVWAAYSQSFIEQFQTIAKERGKNHANQLVDWGDSAIATAKWQFSDFEARYLDCQRLACQDDEPIGVRYSDRIFTPLLQDVYVPLQLSIDARSPGFSVDEQGPERLQNALDSRCVTSIWTLLQNVPKEPVYRKIAIRAWGGYGKTTLLKHVAYTYSTRPYRKAAPRLIPFLLYLTHCWRTLLQLPEDDPLSLPTLLLDYHLKTLPQGADLTPPPNWPRSVLNPGNGKVKAIVLFDGFDEVPPAERAAVSQWLSQQMRHHPNAVFLLTSRPAAYTEHYEGHYEGQRPTASFWVDNFDDEQRRQFVEQWYNCQERLARGGRHTADVQHRAQEKAASLLRQIDQRSELRALSGNALLLNMMARFHREKDGVELPNRRVELYQDICSLQLDRRPRARGIELWLETPGQRQSVLQSVALAMMQQARTDGQEDEGFKQIRRDQLLEQLGAALREHDPEVNPATFLAQIVQVSELMVDKDGGIYEFAHLSFQEFLAASEIVRLKREDWLHDWLAVDAWKPTILFYADLVNPTALIREALARQATTLAYEMWRNTSKRVGLSQAEQQELEALKSTVQNSRYAQLEEYLKTQQWRKADQETYRLMITAVGKEEGQYFEREELLNFPCDELNAIDALWVKYSNGKFGFSVQKNIYVECGATLDGQYPGDKIWYAFCDRVGWRKENSYVSYNDLSFDLRSSSTGELPCCVGLGGGLLRHFGLGVPLLSHSDL